MDIGTIIAGLQAIASVADAMNKAPQLTPAQAEGEKPKKPSTMIVMLPNQTPPTGVSVPPAPPMASDYWNFLPPANVLRNPIWRMPQIPFGVPTYRGVPLITDFPNFYEPSLEALYQLYFGTRR